MTSRSVVLPAPYAPMSACTRPCSKTHETSVKSFSLSLVFTFVTSYETLSTTTSSAWRLDLLVNELWLPRRGSETSTDLVRVVESMALRGVRARAGG